MAYSETTAVQVRAWDRLVGIVAVDPQRRGYAFRYAPEWLRSGSELAPTTMPLSGGRRVYRFDGLPEETFHRLPPMLADSLPDRFGNAVIDAYLGQQGIDPAKITWLDRLAYLGSRGMGALEFRPETAPRHKPTALILGELAQEAKAVVQGSLAADSAPSEDEQASRDTLRQLISVGISAGGARPKAVIAWDPITGDVRSGQLPAEPGYQQWLLKFDGVGLDRQLGSSQRYTRIEYAYSRMVRAAGITMMPTRLLREGGRTHFMTQRFDRVEGDTGPQAAVHMQTLCALAMADFNLVQTNDYGQYLTMIVTLGLGEDALVEGFRRMVFNVAAANHDDHTKNFAFVRSGPASGTEGSGWRLAPAYDITYAKDSGNRWLARHLMSVNGKFESIRRTDLLQVADTFGVPGASAIIGDVLDAVDSWGEFAADAEVPPEAVAEIGADIAEASSAISARSRP